MKKKNRYARTRTYGDMPLTNTYLHRYVKALYDCADEER